MESNSSNLPISPMTDDDLRKALEDNLYTASYYISYIGFAVALFAMGCVVSIKDFSDKDKHMSKSVVIGIAFQSLFQPLIGYGLASVLDMDLFEALALIILSCCPVSPFCAVLVYYGEGVVMVGLSLAMFSTALSAGLVPLWFSIYSTSWTEEYYIIALPSDIALAELGIFIPTALGLLYKRMYGKKKAKRVAKVFSNGFWLAVILGPLLTGIAYPKDFVVGYHIWVAAIVLPLIGFICGLFLSLLFDLPFDICSAISLAVGSPNWYIAKNLSLRFFTDDEALHQVYGLLAITSIALPIEGFVWSLMFRNIHEFVTKISPKCCSDPEDDEEFEVIDVDDEVANIFSQEKIDIEISEHPTEEDKPSKWSHAREAIQSTETDFNPK